MSNRTFCWLFVWIAALFGWYDRVIAVRYGDSLGMFIAGIGGAALIAVLERRLTRKRKEDADA